MPILGGILKAKEKDNTNSTSSIVLDEVITFIVGFLFGVGLLVAGMVRRINILGFLGLGTDWNPSLLFVLGCGVIINVITFSYMICYK